MDNPEKNDCFNVLQSMIEEAQRIQATNKLKKINVLIANDEPFQLMMISSILLKQSFISKID